MNLEKELAAALQRVEPPNDIADRVMQRIRHPHNAGWWLRRLAATLLITTTIGISSYRYVEQQRARREGELAKQMLLTALRITAQKTNMARDAVTRVSQN